MYIARHIENTIREASGIYPVIMVCGQRQVGKSTMLYHIKAEDRKYVSLDDINIRRLAQSDPGLFFETYGYPLLIDEFQRVPEILLEIKRIVDEKKLKGEDTSGMYWLTGSQKFVMMKNISESLAGRIAVFDMSGLSLGELDGGSASCFSPEVAVLQDKSNKNKRKTIRDVYEEIFKGGMPLLRATDIERDRFYMDYINTYLERDIKGLEQVGKLNEFNDFLVFMAARTGQELRYEEIAKNIGISAPTAKAWVAMLERSGILYILCPFFPNISKRLVKTPKAYFMDTGLAAYLCRWDSSETLMTGAMDGAFFETYVVSEIIKSYYNAGKQPDLYYYRDIDKKEIDLLVVRNNKIYPIEIKKSKSPDKPDRNFGLLKRFGMDIQPGIVICMSDGFIPYNKGCYLCPVDVLG